uniref:Retrotransposon protein, putative, Ty1-copia subclass n=1 Tax=Oryza sativa subsp. japonica TaxID=39947 RepID=Q2QUC6_ORYSJ|nr:retrotransposon protein, putative, Ty1-copia subclass [Oryza sativa Japonica Group]
MTSCKKTRSGSYFSTSFGTDLLDVHSVQFCHGTFHSKDCPLLHVFCFQRAQATYTTAASCSTGEQVTTQAVLTQSSDLDEALESFGKKKKDEWTAEEKRKDRKALLLIQFHLSNDILSKVLQEQTAAELWLKLETGSMLNHISVFKEIVANLVSIEVQFHDKDLGLLLLCSLPSSYANFRDTILLSREELILLEVYEALQNREKMKGDCLIVFAGCVAGHDEWIFDTACLFHICINRDWFSSYKFVQNGDVVRMGDDNPREIVGIGSVQIKTHDGMTRTLKDMRHIPRMVRNLISLSTFDAEGYKYSSSGGVVKVSKGSLVYMIGDLNSAKLYVLRGSTLHGSVTATTVSNDEPSKTNMWHMRLGHMSELGMVELMKRNLLDSCTQGNMKLCEHYVFGKHKRKSVALFLAFCSDAFDDYCRKETIVRHHTTPYTPQQNGVAERMNRTIISKARCMLSNARMNKRFWAEATNTALINKSPSTPLNKKTPIELRVFGCTAYAHVDNGKLEHRAIKCLFLGYGLGVKGYKLWNPETKRIVMCKSVVFNESVMFNESLSTDVIPGGSDEEQQYVSVQVEHVDDQEIEIVDNDVHDTVKHSSPVLQPQDQPIAHRRTKRSCGALVHLIEECDMVYYAFSCAEQVNTHEPAAYTEAVVSDDREKLISAMQEEMQSLEKNGTWELVRLPKQKKTIHCKWIFKGNEGLSLSELRRFKASIVAMHDLELEQLDVKTTFLHGELEEEIYMDQPEEFIIPSKEDYICKLKRSLYDLKQSPRQWYKRFDSFMLSRGFKRSEYDSCVYIKFINGSPIYLLLYVDDMLIAAKSKEEITILKKQLTSEFEMKDLGVAKKNSNQQSNNKKVLQHFNMHDAKPVSTPVAPHFKLSALQYASTDEEVEYISRVPYSSAVGSLIQIVTYLAKDQMFHERTKHIDIKYHYVRDVVTQVYLKQVSFIENWNLKRMHRRGYITVILAF